MISPHDRVFNTPERLGEPAAEAAVRQVQLERILARNGYFSCYANTTRNGVEPPLANKVSDSPRKKKNMSVWPRKPAPLTMKKKNRPVENAKYPVRSGIPGATVHDPFLQTPRDTLTGSKYGAVHLSEIEPKTSEENPPLFKPFYPLTSPLRLPAIQREKSSHFENTQKLEKIEPIIEKQIEIIKMNRQRNLPALKEERRRQQKTIKWQRERDFLAWQTDQEKFENSALDGKVYKYTEYEQYPVGVKESMQKCRQENNDKENVQRHKIKRQIKRGVRERFETISCPVLEMTFDTIIR